MKHLTQIGFDFVGAENAYALAIMDNNPIIHEASLELLAALLQQQKGVQHARQILFNITLNPFNMSMQKDAIKLFSSMIDHCANKQQHFTSVDTTKLPPLELAPKTAQIPTPVLMIGGIFGGLLLLNLCGYQLCIHKKSYY